MSTSPFSSPFSTVLIANRGEIAVRVARTCRELGLGVVAVYSTEDSASPVLRMADRAVCIGPAAPKSSYLNAAAIMAAAGQTGADAIHPGYGFLSEDPDFVELATAAGITFIGPPAAVMAKLGDKSTARALMRDAGLPLLPGSVRPLTEVAEAHAFADEIGYPVIIKAVAGGGGRGMRVVEASAGFPGAYRETRATAQAVFGDGRVYVERYLARTRHVEVQVLCDQHGDAVHLGERDCSVQRRHQKLIEEAPAPGLSASLRDEICAAAVRGALAVGYVGAGTFEFLVDPVRDEFFFMEVNCRIQVEHPVTELVTGLDLVEEQVKIAAGHPLPVRQHEIRPRGAAIECRVNAEDPDREFVPAPGVLDRFEPPGGPFVRVDTHAARGARISPAYDSLLAKTVVWGRDRDAALARMRRALGEFEIGGAGVRTTREFLLDVLDHPLFREHRHTTGLVGHLLSHHPESEDVMPHIDPASKVLTLINTFSVEPDNHDRLLEILDDATKNVMSRFPGFISASLHTSLDKTRIANYAQWRSEQDFQNAIRHPDFLPHFQACEQIAVADPRLYWVHSTEEAASDDRA